MDTPIAICAVMRRHSMCHKFRATRVTIASTYSPHDIYQKSLYPACSWLPVIKMLAALASSSTLLSLLNQC